MTETTEIAQEQPTWVKSNPFEHDESLNHVEMETTSEINIPQLGEEITAALSLSEPLHMATQVEHFDQDVSKDNPLYVFFSSKEDLDEKVMNDLLKAHTPAAPEVDEDLEAALAACRAGETLTTKQISLILKSQIGG